MTTFTARTPADLLALVPVVIGFHPEDSVVLLTFGSERPHQGRAVASGDSFQARVDLPVVEDEQRAVASMLRGVVAHHNVRVAAVVLYCDDAEVARSFAGLLVPDLLADGVDVIDVLRADGDRYYCVADAEDLGAPYDVGAHPLTTSGLARGRIVHPSRDALRDSLIGADPTEVRAIDAAAHVFVDALIAEGLDADSAPEMLASQGRWLQSTLEEQLDRPDQLGVAEVARFLVLVSFEPLREVAWSGFTRANAAAHVDFLRDLIRRAPEHLEAGVAGLLGLAAWLAGDGALGWCALDRCLAAQPDDELAQHVAALMESATPPSVWAPIAASGLPIFASKAKRRPGSGPASDLGSEDGSRRRGTGVQSG